jgi:hypothetical protein
MIPAGSYGPLTITGFCAMQGTYSVHGGLTIAPGAGLDAAVFFGFPPFNYGAPCNVFLTVSGGIEVGTNGLLYLGNSTDTGCSSSSNDVVNGGITATGADSVVVHGTTINGPLTVQGGGGAASCAPTERFPFAHYFNIEASRVNGGVSFTGLNTCWIGIIQTQINGGGQVSNNETSDTDAIEIGLNSIHGALSCAGNFLNPAVTPDPTPNAPNGVPTNFFDFHGPNPNTVTGAETGQCAGL